MFFLVESDFVGSALLRESINSSIGDDDKLYFFFTERNTEPTAYSSQTKVARVARVCKVRAGFGIYLELSLTVDLYFSNLVLKLTLTKHFHSYVQTSKYSPWQRQPNLISPHVSGGSMALLLLPGR